MTFSRLLSWSSQGIKSYAKDVVQKDWLSKVFAVTQKSTKSFVHNWLNKRGDTWVVNWQLKEDEESEGVRLGENEANIYSDWLYTGLYTGLLCILTHVRKARNPRVWRTMMEQQVMVRDQRCFATEWVKSRWQHHILAWKLVMMSRLWWQETDCQTGLRAKKENLEAKTSCLFARLVFTLVL